MLHRLDRRKVKRGGVSQLAVLSLFHSGKGYIIWLAVCGFKKQSLNKVVKTSILTLCELSQTLNKFNRQAETLILFWYCYIHIVIFYTAKILYL